VAREEAPPKQQNQECGGNDSPGDQQVEQWPRQRLWFHGDLPLEPIRGAGWAGNGLLEFDSTEYSTLD